MTSRRSPWLTRRVDLLLGVLSGLGLQLPRAAAEDLIADRVRSVGDQMRVTPQTARRYLTDEGIQELAHNLAFVLAREAPGAEILEAPRDTPVPLNSLGRIVTALAESTRVRAQEQVEIGQLRAEIDHLAQAISAIGLLVAEETGAGAVAVPAPLLHRIARYLANASELVADGTVPAHLDAAHASALCGPLQRDAQEVRELAGEDPPRTLRSVD